MSIIAVTLWWNRGSAMLLRELFLADYSLSGQKETTAPRACSFVYSLHSCIVSWTCMIRLKNINLIRVCPWSAAAHLLISSLRRDGGTTEPFPGCIGSVRAADDRNYEQRRARRNSAANEHSEVK